MDVDLSNKNILPLWRRRRDNCKDPRDSSKAKPSRPLSYHVNGVMVTNFPVEDKCCFTFSQPSENQAANASCTGSSSSTVVLKHILNKPSRKSRVVRSISIGRLPSGRFSLSRFRPEDNKHVLLDNGGCDGNRDRWAEEHTLHSSMSMSSPVTSRSHKERVVFGKGKAVPLNCPSPVLCQHNHEEVSSLSSTFSTHTQSHSSSSSIPSLSSLTSSDPSTPRSPSPADRGQSSLPSHGSCSQDGKHALSSSSTSPSLSPSSPSIVLSTNSPAALKTGTQQLIPKALASAVRQRKDPPPGQQVRGLAGPLGFDPSKRAVKSLSMVESVAHVCTGGEHGEGTEGDNQSPRTLRRGLRSPSYRRAVVSGVDLEVPAADPEVSVWLSELDGEKQGCPSIPVIANPETVKPASPGTLKPDNLRLKKVASPKLSKSCSDTTGLVLKDTDTGNTKSPGEKNLLTTQRTFDSEEEDLYQNYREKALHNDSDEDAASREASVVDGGITVQCRPVRTTWSQLTVVKRNGLSDRVSPEERKRQEAIFEVISSEHSYLCSLEILIRMFKNSTELSKAITKTEHHHLFSNIADVCETSQKLFKELEERHQQNIMIDDISDIVSKHAQSNFDPYITYCSNEVYQQRTLQRLVSKNPLFKEVLTKIEAHPDCRNLPMISFLILPMQRITRLPLLMDTICQKTPKVPQARYEACKKALQAVSKVVRQCNEGARTMERTEMMYTINSQLEFKIKPFPLVSSSRWMVKRGELTAFVQDSALFLRRTSRQHVYFFLFNDVLIVTKKKSEDSFTVVDYALRDQIWVSSCQTEDLNLSPVRISSSIISSSTNHLFHLCFCSNYSGEKVLMMVGTDSLNERARWISALRHHERNQDRMDVLQMEVIRTYSAKQPDELSLQVADVVLLSQTVDDGWCEGERLRDGEKGWFLAECAEPITCRATVERNMQRMGRLQGLETNV